jgi:protein-S-isoprenylcysteine O-methyltransferase Ste14
MCAALRPDAPAALWWKSFAGLAFLGLAVAAALFLPAGTVRWWRAWVWMGVFFAAALAITLHFLQQDPELIRRRLAAGPVAEARRVQRVIQWFASGCFLAVFVLAGLDRRLGWSSVPAAVSVAADGIVAAGFAVVFLVFRENSHASAVVEVSAGQRVVSTGPYRHVRHPMYSGALLLLLATPPALGSLAALPAVLALAVVIVARLLDEERLLSRELPGYDAYRRAVRRRLVPGVW